MKAIQTDYAGCKFRSRLEARWAVFFDALGIVWEYEPEGFDLGPAGWYLPDFRLAAFDHGHDMWVEIKGVMDPTSERKIEAFRDHLWANDGDIPVTKVAVFGDIPNPNAVDDWGPSRADGQVGWDVGFDDNYVWCVGCRGTVGFEFEGRGERVHHATCNPANEYYSGKVRTGDDHRILAAYTAARSARFEHGETPIPPYPWPPATAARNVQKVAAP